MYHQYVYLEVFSAKQVFQKTKHWFVYLHSKRNFEGLLPLLWEENVFGSALRRV